MDNFDYWLSSANDEPSKSYCEASFIVVQVRPSRAVVRFPGLYAVQSLHRCILCIWRLARGNTSPSIVGVHIPPSWVYARDVGKPFSCSNRELYFKESMPIMHDCIKPDMRRYKSFRNQASSHRHWSMPNRFIYSARVLLVFTLVLPDDKYPCVFPRAQTHRATLWGQVGVRFAVTVRVRSIYSTRVVLRCEMCLRGSARKCEQIQ